MIDWSASNDIEAMLKSLPEGQFRSELRLFAADCAARVLRFLPEPEFARALDLSRQFATGNCSEEELQQRVDAAANLLSSHVDVPSTRDFAGSAVIDASSLPPATATKIAASASCALQAVASAAADEALEDEYDVVFDNAIGAESRVQCDFLRSRIPNTGWNDPVS